MCSAVLSTRRHPAQPVSSLPILHSCLLIEIQALACGLWSQNYGTSETLLCVVIHQVPGMEYQGSADHECDAMPPPPAGDVACGRHIRTSYEYAKKQQSHLETTIIPPTINTIIHESINMRTAVSLWGQTTQFSSSLSPKRDCGSKGVSY